MMHHVKMKINKQHFWKPENVIWNRYKYVMDNVVVAPSNLTGPITSVGSATAVAAQTGTGSTFVMNLQEQLALRLFLL